MERVYEGYIPYKDIKLGYTPLWFYIIAGVKMIFNIPNGYYEPYLLIHYLTLISTSGWLYLLLREFSINKIVSILSSFLFILISYKCQGDCVLLEIPSVFWGLLSCLLILKFKNQNNLNYLWIGVICSFSFLTKQFGIGFLPLNLLLIVSFIDKYKIKKLLCLFLGYIIPLLFCFIYWEKDFLSLIFSNYGTISAKDAGLDTSFIAKISHIFNAIIRHIRKINPVVVLSLLYIPLLIKQNRWKEYLFSICGLGFILQFYFTPFSDHYQLYVIPFSVIIVALLLDLHSNSIYKTILICMVIVTMLYINYRIYYVINDYTKLNIKQEQKALAEWVKDNTDDSKNLFIINSHLFSTYLLTQRLPPNIKTIGYSFGPLGINENECSRQIDKTDYILRFTKDDPYESFFTFEMKEKCEAMPTIYYNDEIVLHMNLKDCN